MRAYMQTKSSAKNRIIARERNLAEIQKFTLFSDVFLSIVLRDVRACEYVLRILLKDDSLELEWAETQYKILKLASRSAWLDVLACGKNGTLYGLEIQNKNNVDHPRRVRFYGSMIDSNFLQKGEEFEAMPELHFIYICRKDFLKTMAAAQEVDRIWHDTEKPYLDGEHLLYVNAQIQDGTEIARLMEYFKTADPNDMSHGALSRRVRFLKKDKGGQKIMCEITEKIERRGIRQGRRQGIAQTISRYIHVSLADGQSVEDVTRQIQRYFSLTPAQAQSYMRKAAVHFCPESDTIW